MTLRLYVFSRVFLLRRLGLLVQISSRFYRWPKGHIKDSNRLWNTGFLGIRWHPKSKQIRISGGFERLNTLSPNCLWVVFWFAFGWAWSRWAGCLGWKALGCSSSYYPNGHCFCFLGDFSLSWSLLWCLFVLFGWLTALELDDSCFCRDLAG